MKGIMFKPFLFREILKGNKRQTRRIYKERKPQYNLGEVVYMKEPYMPVKIGYFYQKEYRPLYFPIADVSKGWGVFPKAEVEGKWKNKLFMPAEAARFFIYIKGVTVERVIDITLADALAEGFDTTEDFIKAWNRINPSAPANDDQYCWVYEFELLELKEKTSQNIYYFNRNGGFSLIWDDVRKEVDPLPF